MKRILLASVLFLAACASPLTLKKCDTGVIIGDVERAKRTARKRAVNVICTWEY